MLSVLVQAEKRGKTGVRVDFLSCRRQVAPLAAGLDGLRGRLVFAEVALGIAILAAGNAALSAWFQAALPVGVWGGCTSTESRSGRVFVTGVIREHPTHGGLAVEFGGVCARDVWRVACAQQHARNEGSGCTFCGGIVFPRPVDRPYVDIPRLR